MGPHEICSGLWRWTAPHPEWNPAAAPGSSSDWPREVGCVLYETPDAAVFIDPLVPLNAAEALWRWADQHCREKSVSVLTTIAFHRRSRDLLLERYRASPSRNQRSLPQGVQSRQLRGAGETLFWLGAPRTLVAGDRLVTDESGALKLCPESWLRYLPSGLTRDGLRELLLALLELPIERVLVSHGEPILSDAQQALAQALR
jgi:hypothetical protein